MKALLRWTAAAVLAAAASAGSVHAQELEKKQVSLGVGGKTLLY